MKDEYNRIKDLKDLISKSSKKYRDKILYKLEDREITYREMQDKVDSIGTALIQMGLKEKKVAIISENRYEWEIAYFSITCGTGIAVPIDKTLTEPEIKNILERTKAQAIFCSKEYEEILIRIKEEIRELRYIISFDREENSDNVLTLNHVIEKGRNLINTGNKEFINANIDNNSVAAIMFTSGTTNKSKAVMLSHKNICSNVMNVALVFQISSKDIALSVLPLNHVLEGVFCLMLTIYRGATRTYCNDLKDIIEDINRKQISFMGAVPSVYDYIYKRIDEINKENINVFISAGASLDTELEKKYKRKGIKLIQAYGATETSPVISISNKETHKIGSVGRIIPNIEFKLINENQDGIGEIAVRGENVFLGYYKDSQATKAVLEDGWFYTGDLAKVDDDGYIFFCGRIKNMIVLPNGKKVFPEELENMINKIDGVKESLVYDKSIENSKTSIGAKIVCYDITQKEKIMQEIKNINQMLPKYKMISSIYITKDKILRTETGKIRRKEEKEKIIEHINKKEITKEISESVLEKIKSIIGNQLGINEKEIETEAHLVNDLGADSLDKVEIILQLEREFKIKNLKEEISKINTIKDIEQFLGTPPKNS